MTHHTHAHATQRERDKGHVGYVAELLHLLFSPLPPPLTHSLHSLTIHNPHVASFTWSSSCAPCFRSLSESLILIINKFSLEEEEGERGFHCSCCCRRRRSSRMESTESSYVSSPEGPRKHAASPPPKPPSLGISDPIRSVFSLLRFA